MAAKKPIHGRGSESRQLRIIAGRWRGRRWRFPDLNLRPTPDRVRETLFNWLQPLIAGRSCLDLFAGSGALGLEALSRGAAHACFIDRDPQAIAAIAATAREFGAVGVETHCADARQFLQGQAMTGERKFDLVFVDPPFDSGLAEPAMQLLADKRWLAPGALVYVERSRGVALSVPDGWQQLKSGTAGVVSYHLYSSAGS